MDETDILARVGEIIRTHNETMRRLGRKERILTIAPQSLAELVGDPDTHPVREYFERVTALSRSFHLARREALLIVKQHGNAAQYCAFTREAARGWYALTCLHIAGLLYRLHLVAIVDVSRHELAVQTATTVTFPSFS